MNFFGVEIKYKGAFKSEDQLSKGELPPNAVKIKENTVLNGVYVGTSLYLLIIAILLVILLTYGSYHLHGKANMLSSFTIYELLIGLILAYVFLFPHEWLHAICYGKGAEVEIYSKLFRYKFVYSTNPITKTRSMILYLLPGLLLGWVPFIIWAITPLDGFFGHIMWVFSSLMILCAAGDYYSVYNTLRQMPKGSMEQVSGNSRYWFMPEKQKDSTP